MKLQVAALQREVSTLRDSLKAKDAALTNAQEDGSTQVQELQAARQGLLHRLETTEQQMQVQNMLLRSPAMLQFQTAQMLLLHPSSTYPTDC